MSGKLINDPKIPFHKVCEDCKRGYYFDGTTIYWEGITISICPWCNPDSIPQDVARRAGITLTPKPKFEIIEEEKPRYTLQEFCDTCDTMINILSDIKSQAQSRANGEDVWQSKRFGVLDVKGLSILCNYALDTSANQERKAKGEQIVESINLQLGKPWMACNLTEQVLRYAEPEDSLGDAADVRTAEEKEFDEDVKSLPSVMLW
jgi:hypothetical protein